MKSNKQLIFFYKNKPTIYKQGVSKKVFKCFFRVGPSVQAILWQKFYTHVFFFPRSRNDLDELLETLWWFTLFSEHSVASMLSSDFQRETVAKKRESALHTGLISFLKIIYHDHPFHFFLWDYWWFFEALAIQDPKTTQKLFIHRKKKLHRNNLTHATSKNNIQWSAFFKIKMHWLLCKQNYLSVGCIIELFQSTCHVCQWMFKGWYHMSLEKN